jgi:hypothetical protein
MEDHADVNQQRWDLKSSHRGGGAQSSSRADSLRGSARIKMTDEELIYFSMGPWDMETEDLRPLSRQAATPAQQRDEL